MPLSFSHSHLLPYPFPYSTTISIPNSHLLTNHSFPFPRLRLSPSPPRRPRWIKQGSFTEENMRRKKRSSNQDQPKSTSATFPVAVTYSIYFTCSTPMEPYFLLRFIDSSTFSLFNINSTMPSLLFSLNYSILKKIRG